MFLIEVTLDDNPVRLQLCRCLTVQSVTAVLGTLLSARETRPITVRRDPLWPEPSTEPAADAPGWAT